VHAEKNFIRVDHDDEKSGGRKFDRKLREMSFVHERLHAECEDCSTEGLLQHLFGPDMHWRQDMITRLRTGLRVKGHSPLQDNEFYAMMEFVCLCFFHHKSPTLLCYSNTSFLYGRSPLMKLDRFEELLGALGTTRPARDGDSWELAMDQFEPEVFHAYSRLSELFSKLGYSKADSDVTVDDFKYHLRFAMFSQMGVARSYHRGSDLGPNIHMAVSSGTHVMQALALQRKNDTMLSLMQKLCKSLGHCEDLADADLRDMSVWVDRGILFTGVVEL
jgi:hypothetical protein